MFFEKKVKNVENDDRKFLHGNTRSELSLEQVFHLNLLLLDVYGAPLALAASGVLNNARLAYRVCMYWYALLFLDAWTCMYLWKHH